MNEIRLRFRRAQRQSGRVVLVVPLPISLPRMQKLHLHLSECVETFSHMSVSSVWIPDRGEVKLYDRLRKS